MKEQGICLICGESFERKVKPDGRKRLGCGECGDSPKTMARSMFLSKKVTGFSTTSDRGDEK